MPRSRHRCGVGCGLWLHGNNLNGRTSLAAHGGFGFFDGTEDFVRTGPAGINVNDI
jgi:glycerate-2-kinase